MKLEAVRTFALSLPETTEEPHLEAGSLRVKGKIFCTVLDDERLHLRIGADEVRALIAEDPAAFEVIIWGKREVPDWVRVNLPKAKAAHLKELLEDAWRYRAPKRLVADYDAARGS